VAFALEQNDIGTRVTRCERCGEAAQAPAHHQHGHGLRIGSAIVEFDGHGLNAGITWVRSSANLEM
jgi:hypothetical protein